MKGSPIAALRLLLDQRVAPECIRDGTSGSRANGTGRVATDDARRQDRG